MFLSRVESQTESPLVSETTLSCHNTGVYQKDNPDSVYHPQYPDSLKVKPFQMYNRWDCRGV